MLSHTHSVTFLLRCVVLGAISFSTTTSSELAVVPRDPEDSLDAVQLAVDAADDITASNYQSRGVTAGTSAVTVHVPVGESMLTLLLQLFRRFSQAGVYRLSLPSSSQSAATAMRVGDAEFYLCRVLDKVCSESAECADIINSVCQSPDSGGDATQKEDSQHEDKDERCVCVRAFTLLYSFSLKNSIVKYVTPSINR